MSALANTNGEAAREWIERASLRCRYGVLSLEEGDTKEAVRNFASAAETALKAVYIRYESYYPRVHDIGELVRGCPDRGVLEAVEGYSEGFVRDFSKNYLAPYVLVRPVPLDKVEECRQFAEKIVRWAEDVVRPDEQSGVNI